MSNQLQPIDHFRKDLEAYSHKIKSSLPPHVPVERFCRAAVVAVENNSDLLSADSTTLFNSLSRCAQDGLIPDNREAALIIFNSKSGNDWVKKVQYMPMVDGVLKRARQSGEISTITARPVYENDDFDYWIDENGEHLNYKPYLRGDRGQFIMVFAMAKTKSGELIVEPMTKDDVDKVRLSSKTPDKGPWKDWYERMACKSALHRLARRLPNSSEIMEMLSADNHMYTIKNNSEHQEAEKDITPAPPEFYDEARFKLMLPKWGKSIENGINSSDAVIQTVNQGDKGQLTENMIIKINEYKLKETA